MKNKTYIVVIGLLALCCLVGLSEYLPTRFDAASQVKMAAFPLKVADWHGADVPLSKEDYAILETNNLIMRQYKDSKGRSLMLYIIYSDDNRKVTHPPEVCYMGSGATITNKSPFVLSPKITANKMVAELKEGRELVVYWFRAGNYNTNNYFEQQLRIVARRTWGQRTSAAMIRISADMKENDEQATTQMILDFSQRIESLLSKYVP